MESPEVSPWRQAWSGVVAPLLLAVALVTPGCSGVKGPPGPVASARLTGLGDHSHPAGTRSREAQRDFDRGLTLAYAFGHRAAEQEFRRAAAADPGCALAWWGVALVNGPHINFPAVPPDNARTAWDALQRARALAGSSTPVGQALIEALGARHSDPQPDDRSALDRAYAEAMRGVRQRFPRDADVAVLCAEALMDLHPWDVWNKDGRPQPWTPEIVDLLEEALALDPRHPGALHLYIHALEASPDPRRAAAAADRLGPLVPGAGHLVHMPSHIYARTGRWRDAAESNRRAMGADARYRAAFPEPGFYAMYMAHNTHFLAYTAMMRGRSAEAVALARRMVAEIPESFVRDHAAVVDGYMVFVPEVLMRFGRWEEILAEPRPRPGLPLSLALWHFTRAVSLTALDRLPEARLEQQAFLAASAAVPPDAAMGNSSARDILVVATRLLGGEMAAKAGQFDVALAELRRAVEAEDALRYDEPPDWIQPTRHTLGAVLLRAGRPAEAEPVYREDLRQYPANGWSLHGLSQSLRAQGRGAEARRQESLFRWAWRDADLHISASCLCQPGR